MVMKDSKRSQAVGLRATANISRISAVAYEFWFLYVERLSNVSLIGDAICNTNGQTNDAYLLFWFRCGLLGNRFKLTWLALGGDPAARSRRVEQFTAL